ncbi:unnamed protein product [Polarella glacialis]|uniref:Glutaredoxin domain-containing protein n=1 Tax=Polarella glacialis TaxID=89957 RepID=A0A813M1Q2_POLGL|nr:unnamed protein product [Polarella glacialis]|mmetsp:Transcript_95843/g.172902  ORF Transcript_95843/g.172902 Transcript_95843/m.172902 type:complete len:170 (-) Transcript_95843:175-684(-)
MMVPLGRGLRLSQSRVLSRLCTPLPNQLSTAFCGRQGTSVFPCCARGFCGHSDFAPKSNVAGAETDKVQDMIKNLVTTNKVVLFMKGSPDAPQCGFSKAVAGALQDEGCADYAYVDVLKYPEVREGVKKFSDWPTVPQLYVKGEFVGGCDIVMQMHKEGELKDTLTTSE